MPDDESRLEWWVNRIICPVLLLALSISAIVWEGGVFGSPSSFGMSLLGLLSIFTIYGSVREELMDQKGEGDGDPTLEEILEPLKADSSVEAVIYRWMTAAFAIISALPESVASAPDRVFILLIAGIGLWVRAGAKDASDETVPTLIRVGAAVAGIASGVVLGLAGRLLVSALLA
jgi:hypothetical protein